MTVIYVDVDDELHARVKATAATQRKTLKDWVVEALGEKLEREEAPPPREGRGR